MFFLRHVVLHKTGGEEFLRRHLRRGPLSLFPWTQVDSRIADFTAGDKLPEVNEYPRRAIIALILTSCARALHGKGNR